MYTHMYIYIYIYTYLHTHNYPLERFINPPFPSRFGTFCFISFCRSTSSRSSSAWRASRKASASSAPDASNAMGSPRKCWICLGKKKKNLEKKRNTQKTDRFKRENLSFMWFLPGKNGEKCGLTWENCGKWKVCAV